MLRLDRVIKPWKDAAALCDHINLYGFWNETAFLTKSGDLGMVLRVTGVDYESLDRGQQEYAVKRLEAALKLFGPGFHIYQYLFKTNRPQIPFAKYDDPIVQTGQDRRRQFFQGKRGSALRDRNLLLHSDSWPAVEDGSKRGIGTDVPRSGGRRQRTEGAVQRPRDEKATALADRARPGASGTTGAGIH